jgi:hypothetical protein
VRPARAAATLAVAAALLAARPARAQVWDDPVKDDDYRVDHFLEHMYIGLRASPKADAHDLDVFEARVAPHLFYRGARPALVTPTESTDRRSTHGWSFVFTPAFRLRMTTTSSNPVRTPSFNPQFVTIQHFWVWGMLENEQGVYSDWRHDDPAHPERAGWIKMLAASYTLAHHSNGQEDCTFEPAQGPCPKPPFTTLPPINTRSGNYGTNYEEAGLHFKWLKLDAGGTTAGYLAHETWSAELKYERYQGTIIAWWLPGGLTDDDPLRPIFGLHRLTASGEHETLLQSSCFARLRLRVDLTAISGPAGKVFTEPKGRVSFDVAALFRDQGGFGLFARVFYGQDYYNIRLLDVAPMAIVGLTWESAPMQRFRVLGKVKSGTQTTPDPGAGTHI